MTEYDRERKNLIKVTRAMVRLRHSIAADNELVELLPQILDRFDKAVASGQPFELAASSLLSEIEDAG